MAYVSVNYGEIARFMDSNDSVQLINKARFYKQKDLWDDFFGFRYCAGKCTFLHELLRRSDKETIIAVLEYLTQTIGQEKLAKEANDIFDKTGRNCMIIAAKHCRPDFTLLLMKKYQFTVNHYSDVCCKSAFSYALKRKKFQLAVQMLQRMNPKYYNEVEMGYFIRDLEVFRNILEETGSLDIQSFEALTMTYTPNGRVCKALFNPVNVSPKSFKKNRLRQILRQVSSQLYFRWKFFLKIPNLEDVQILFIENMEDNPTRKPMMFIACTPPRISKEMEKDFKSMSFRTMLTSTYNAENDENNLVAKLSNRYCRKLTSRVWSKNMAKMTKQSKCLAHLLGDNQRKMQKVIYADGNLKMPHFKCLENTSYLINSANEILSNEIHAENILCAIIQHLKNDMEVQAILYGKSRPCFSCMATLTRSSVDHYNTYPAFLSMSTLSRLGMEDRMECLKLLHTTPSHVTQTESNGFVTILHEYDTLSESDSESS